MAFSAEVATVLQAAREFEARHHLGLVPGFTVATLTFVAFLLGKRRELQDRTSAMAAEAREARSRAAEFERLVTFWQALTRASDLDAIRDTLAAHLPGVAGSADVWVVAEGGDGWKVVTGPEQVATGRGGVAVVALAQQALAAPRADASAGRIDLDGQACFPMTAEGSDLGVLGLPVSSPALDPARQLVVGATVALVGVSLNGARMLKETRESSLRDSLTGCANRAHAMQVMATELSRARRSRQPVSLVMFDVDRFKSINDRYGHLCGDTVLAEVGARLRGALRSSDLKCRYGGEEFLVMLPDTPIDGGRRAAETLRRELTKIAVPWEGETVSVTGSFGVACSRPGDTEPESLIARADEALYRAKNEGRDLVRVQAEP